jgi:ferritin-like metal-binding protein YciE
MGNTMRTLRDLFLRQLHELRAGERHHAETLVRLAGAAASPELAAALRRHREETLEQARRLDATLAIASGRLGPVPLPPGPERESHGMYGLMRDCLELAGSDGVEPHVRDAAIIGLVQHVGHDEIAGYGCARTWARLLGLEEAAVALQRSLSEEKALDTELSRIAETLNKAALAPSLLA